jgi:hypothetical protein
MPVRSSVEKFRLPTALDSAVKLRLGEIPYSSLSEYVVALIRYDLLTRKPHTTTASLARLSRADQDRVDDEIAQMFGNGENLGGGWFEERLKEAVQAAGMEAPDMDRITQELLKRIARRGG